MRVLFLHPNFPAQFRHLATRLAADSSNQVAFGTTRREGQMPGVMKALYEPKRKSAPETHLYLHTLEDAVLGGQAVFRMGQQLAEQGFVPDIVVAHSGWGPGLYVPEVFPDAKLISYIEWYYRAHGSNADFFPDDQPSVDDELKFRTWNSMFLLDIEQSDWMLTPTHNQLNQVPEFLHSKISTLHDGIDVDFFSPQPTLGGFRIPGLDLSAVDEIVTYATRGMEPYRGFPQMMRAVAELHERRPGCHVVVAGTDRVAYGKALPEGMGWRQIMLDELGDRIDASRLHFVGSLPYPQYRDLLAASDAHLYLTIPFVLSWGMMEAMSTGALLIGSDTPPVQEMVTHGETGLLVDFFDHHALADTVVNVLDNPNEYKPLRDAARQLIVERYELSAQLDRQTTLLEDVIAGRTPDLYRSSAVAGQQ